MKIVIPMIGRVRMCIRSNTVTAQRTDADHYNLTGETFQLSEVTADQVFVFPDEVEVTEGEAITEELLSNALPLDQFIRVSAEDAMTNALGLLLRQAVADGRVTDEELLSIQPALEGRLWQPQRNVQFGDVYSFGGVLFKCLQAHTTQGDWAPDLTPALWQRVEVISNAVRVWAAGIFYIIGDEVAYPDESGDLYTCQQAHTALTGWEPPNAPALWVKKEGES